jgi:hypothetical protein
LKICNPPLSPFRKGGSCEESLTKKKNIKKQKEEKESTKETYITICTNVECKLRRVGCKGFEGCPGYKGR